jgi:hypothetical protein
VGRDRVPHDRDLLSLDETEEADMRVDRKQWIGIIVTAAAAALASARVGHAQPGPPPEPAPAGSGAGSAAGSGAVGPGGVAPGGVAPGGVAPGTPYDDEVPPPHPPSTAPPEVVPLPAPEPPHPDVLPQVLVAPAARLLPAGVFYWRTGLDTSGGLSSDARIGLGDVAEFGVALTDLIRARDSAAEVPTRINGYVNAIFKMGVAEDRLFAGQPALALGFRKSFERAPGPYATRFAELYLVATRSLGARTSIHVGGVFWDASIKHADDPVFALHDRGVGQQLRPFGGIELRPLEDAQILLDVYWAPEFCYACEDDAARIRLQPILSWGVRYELADWIDVESGVRVPDIGDANLLDAQIFGQVVFVDWRLHRAVTGK